MSTRVTLGPVGTGGPIGPAGPAGAAGSTGPQGPPGIGNWRGVWSNATSYILQDEVQGSDGLYYFAVQANTGHDPTTDTAHTYWVPTVPSSVVTDSSGPDTTSVVTKAGSPSSSRRRGLRDFVSLSDYTTASMRAGNADATAAALQWLVDAAALATSTGYGDSLGVKAYAPAGLWTLSQGLPVPKAVKLTADGPRSTIFRPGAVFNDIAVIKASIPNQEFYSVEGLSVWGSHGSDTPINAANGGVSTTVSSVTQSGSSIAGLNISPTVPFQLGLTSTSGWATSGYALVNGTLRVLYDGISGGALQNCFITNGYAIIAVGVSVAPITTNNVHGLFVGPCGSNSHFEQIEAEHCGGSSVLVISPNCIAFRDIWAQKSNRDSFLITGVPLDLALHNICAQYPGQNGTSGTFACLHIYGDPAGAFFQGKIKLDNLYFEIDRTNTIGLWLQDIGGIVGDVIALVGGSNYSGQVCVQIDSDQATPLKNDSLHSFGIDLRSVMVSQLDSGRITIQDNVRGHTITGPSGQKHYIHPRYAPDDTTAGVPPFVASQFYLAGQLATTGTTIIQRNTDGWSGASYAADIANWTAVSSGAASADRTRTLRLGTLAALRETVEGASWNDKLVPNNLTLTSGTQLGAPIPVLKGESYGHAIFQVGTTGATLGTNSDSHWYVAIYDASGNLVTQAADQGTATLAASSIKKLALNATITPSVDALYTAVLMIYVGTGGTPVTPTITGAVTIGTGVLITGMPLEGLTANAGQTTGTAPGTLGTTTATSSVPWIALYT